MNEEEIHRAVREGIREAVANVVKKNREVEHEAECEVALPETKHVVTNGEHASKS